VGYISGGVIPTRQTGCHDKPTAAEHQALFRCRPVYIISRGFSCVPFFWSDENMQSS